MKVDVTTAIIYGLGIITLVSLMSIQVGAADETLVWIDPVTHLRVRCVAVEYAE